MRIGTKVGLSGCAAGFAVAIYFGAIPTFSALSSGASLSTGSLGATLGVGFCAAGALLGVYFGRRRGANA